MNPVSFVGGSLDIPIKTGLWEVGLRDQPPGHGHTGNWDPPSEFEEIRYQEVSRRANQRYHDALAVVDDPTPAIQLLDDVTICKSTASGRGVRAFNPLSRDDTLLFQAMMAGEHCIRGLSNADIRAHLEGPLHSQDVTNQ